MTQLQDVPVNNSVTNSTPVMRQNLPSMVGFINVGAVDKYPARREAAPRQACLAGRPAVCPERAARPVTARQSQAVAVVRNAGSGGRGLDGILTINGESS